MSTARKCYSCNGDGVEKEWLLTKEKNPHTGKPCITCQGTGFSLSSEEEVICPCCGYLKDDVWELGDKDDRYQCESCEKYFAYDSYTIRTFQSLPVPCLNGEPHKWEKAIYWEEHYLDARQCSACHVTQYKKEEYKD